MISAKKDSSLRDDPPHGSEGRNVRIPPVGLAGDATEAEERPCAGCLRVVRLRFHSDAASTGAAVAPPSQLSRGHPLPRRPWDRFHQRQPFQHLTHLQAVTEAEQAKVKTSVATDRLTAD